MNVRNDLYHNKFSENLDYFNVEWSNVKFKNKYFNYIKNSKKIFLSLNTIFCDMYGKKGSIDKIRCFKNKFFFIKSENVILSCGGIENSRLLLLSLKNNKSLFKFDLPIGKYFMDHPKHNVGEGILLYKKFSNFLKSQNLFKFPSLECKNITLSLNKEFLEKNKILNSGLEINLKELTPTQILFVKPHVLRQDLFKKFIHHFTLKMFMNLA